MTCSDDVWEEEEESTRQYAYAYGNERGWDEERILNFLQGCIQEECREQERLEGERGV